MLEYAGVDVSELRVTIYECSSISTLEWAWNHMPGERNIEDGRVIDQAWFCGKLLQRTNSSFSSGREK